MRIMGIDEGSSKAGLAVVDITKEEKRLVYATQLRFDVVPYSKMKAPERIFHLFKQVGDAILLWKPDLVSIEHIRVNHGGKNMDSMMVVARAQSAVSIASFLHGVKSVELMANQVRSCLGVRAQRRDAAKDALRSVINTLFQADLAELGFPNGLSKSKEDISDAVGLALAGNIHA